MSKKNLKVTEIEEVSEQEGDEANIDFNQEEMLFYEIIISAGHWSAVGHKFTSQENWDKHSIKAFEEFGELVSVIKDDKLADKLMDAALSLANARSRDIFIKVRAGMGSNLNDSQTIEGFKAFESCMEGFSQKP